MRSVLCGVRNDDAADLFNINQLLLIIMIIVTKNYFVYFLEHGTEASLYEYFLGPFRDRRCP